MGVRARHTADGQSGDAATHGDDHHHRPPAFLLLRQFLAFGDFLKLRVQLRQFGGVQAQIGDAALVIDRHRGPRRKEENGETLPAALRVPDHARATVARLAAVHPSAQICPRLKR